MRPLPRLLRYAPKAREGTLKLHFYLESITSRQAKHGMPTRHQFTNLPLFIAFSFLGLTRAVLEDIHANLRYRVGDVD